MDYYAVLGIKKNATLDEIKDAYRKMAKIYHPDVNKSSDAKKRMQRINEAYRALCEEKMNSDSYNGSSTYYDDIDVNSRDITINPPEVYVSVVTGKKYYYSIKIESMTDLRPDIRFDQFDKEWIIDFDPVVTPGSVFPIELKISVLFEKVGKFRHIIIVMVNGIPSKEIKLSFDVSVPKPAFTLSKPSLAFDSVPKGNNPGVRRVSITNKGDKVENQNISISSPDVQWLTVSRRSTRYADFEVELTPKSENLDVGVYNTIVSFEISYNTGSTKLEFPVTLTIRKLNTRLSFGKDLYEIGPYWIGESNTYSFELFPSGDIPKVNQLNIVFRNSPAEWTVDRISPLGYTNRFYVHVSVKPNNISIYNTGTLIAYLDGKAMATTVVQVNKKGFRPQLTVQSVTHATKQTVRIGKELKGIIELNHTGADIDSLKIETLKDSRYAKINTKSIIHNGRVHSIEYTINYNGKETVLKPTINIVHVGGSLAVSFEIHYHAYNVILIVLTGIALMLILIVVLSNAT